MYEVNIVQVNDAAGISRSRDGYGRAGERELKLHSHYWHQSLEENIRSACSQPNKDCNVVSVCVLNH